MANFMDSHLTDMLYIFFIRHMAYRIGKTNTNVSYQPYS